MAISVTYNGQPYNIPEANDRSWADGAAGLTAYLIALATNQPHNSIAEISIPGSVINQTVVLLTAAGRPLTINNIVGNTGAGTCTVAIKINGVSITGLSAVAVTSAKTTTNASALNAMAQGDRVTLVITAAASASDFELAVNYT